MSLSRTAYRLTTMEALRPTDALETPETLPTLAGLWVFDSRIDPIEELPPNEQRQYIVVFTEDDNGDPAQMAGGPPFKRKVDLCIEMGVVVSSVAAPGAEYTVGYPETDPELEADLDLLEAQVRFALFYGPTGKLWRKLTGSKVTEINSLPHRTSEERTRLAQRTLRLKSTIPDDSYDPSPAVNPSGNDRLPEPLRSVVAALGNGCYGKKLGVGLAAKAPVMPVAVPLKSVGIEIAADDTAQNATTFAPRVSADVENLDQ